MQLPSVTYEIHAVDCIFHSSIFGYVSPLFSFFFFFIPHGPLPPTSPVPSVDGLPNGAGTVVRLSLTFAPVAGKQPSRGSQYTRNAAKVAVLHPCSFHMVRFLREWLDERVSILYMT